MAISTDIPAAVRLLAAGRLVAIPTETVYGLAADARRADAVGRIFTAKGRPATNPLIVHVHDIPMARKYAADWPRAAQLLAERFWPGPLTILLPRIPEIPDAVTAGLANVGLRVPAHPVALELLRQFGGPLAAPSANRSNRTSPTRAEHVEEELGDAVDLILDGGACQVGIESTVIDLSGPPMIWRPGGVSRERIEEVIGPVVMRAILQPADQPAASPGLQRVHYAPRTPAYYFRPEQAGTLAGMEEVGIIAMRPLPGVEVGRVIVLPDEPEGFGRGLYAGLRELDAGGYRAIYVELPPEEPEWVAVRDRVMRACVGLRASSM